MRFCVVCTCKYIGVGVDRLRGNLLPANESRSNRRPDFPDGGREGDRGGHGLEKRCDGKT